MNRPERPMGLNRLIWLLATAGGAGLSPWAPGTMGSIVGLMAYRLCLPGGLKALGVILVGATVAGVWLSAHTARALQVRDPSVVVWDEVVGMMVAAMPAGRSVPMMLVAFGLFRVLDIFKPPPIRQLERLPGGWGIMADDVAAGAVAALLLYGFKVWAGGSFHL